MKKLADLIDGDPDEFEIEYRIHATNRMFQRNIDAEDVEHVMMNGIVIETYFDDFPLPSVLIYGRSYLGAPLHVVAGVNVPERRLVVITVYEPDPEKWTDNFSRRIK